MPHSRCSKSGCKATHFTQVLLFSGPQSPTLKWAPNSPCPDFSWSGWEAQRRQWIWPMSFANCKVLCHRETWHLCFTFIPNDRTETTCLFRPCLFFFLELGTTMSPEMSAMSPRTLLFVILTIPSRHSLLFIFLTMVVYRHALTHGGLRPYASENRDPAVTPHRPTSFIYNFFPLKTYRRSDRPSSEIFLHQLTGTQFWMLVPEGQGVPATHLHEACLVTEPTPLSHFQHQIAIRATERMK